MFKSNTDHSIKLFICVIWFENMFTIWNAFAKLKPIFPSKRFPFKIKLNHPVGDLFARYLKQLRSWKKKKLQKICWKREKKCWRWNFLHKKIWLEKDSKSFDTKMYILRPEKKLQKINKMGVEILNSLKWHVPIINLPMKSPILERSSCLLSNFETLKTKFAHSTIFEQKYSLFTFIKSFKTQKSKLPTAQQFNIIQAIRIKQF